MNSVMEKRIEGRKKLQYWDVSTLLAHFAIITYALPKERLMPHIPSDRFEIPEFSIKGKKMALMSAVPFLDKEFHFHGFFPFWKFTFPQTNYRVYVIDKKTGEHCVWFFGTTLGSWTVNVPKYLFQLPWHKAKYEYYYSYNSQSSKYDSFYMKSWSNWGSSFVQLQDTGMPFSDAEGFSSLEEMKTILTHPVAGYFYRRDGQLGTYSIWHEEMKLTSAKPIHLYFSLYERLGLLDRHEMNQPLHLGICPEILFEVYLPPKPI